MSFHVYIIIRESYKINVKSWIFHVKSYRKPPSPDPLSPVRHQNFRIRFCRDRILESRQCQSGKLAPLLEQKIRRGADGKRDENGNESVRSVPDPPPTPPFPRNRGIRFSIFIFISTRERPSTVFKGRFSVSRHSTRRNVFRGFSGAGRELHALWHSGCWFTTICCGFRKPPFSRRAEPFWTRGSAAQWRS